jgi:quinol monooxygenase YgiN
MMSVTYLIEFDVRPKERDRFLSLLNNVLDAMRGETNFISATLNCDPQNENRFMLHESWQDHDEVVAVQVARTYRQEWHAALPEILSGERRISMWQMLRTDAVQDQPKG